MKGRIVALMAVALVVLVVGSAPGTGARPAFQTLSALALLTFPRLKLRRCWRTVIHRSPVKGAR